MKTEQSMEEKIGSAEEKMPGIEKKLKPTCVINRFYGMYQDTYPEDIEYIETPEYHIVGAKMKQELNNDIYRHRVEWTEWIQLFYRKKEENAKIKVRKTKEVVTKHYVDNIDENQDRRELWPYNYVQIKAVGPKTIKVAWANEEGRTIQRSTLELRVEKEKKD